MRRMLTVTLTFPITFMVVGFLYFTFRIIALGEFTRELDHFAHLTGSAPLVSLMTSGLLFAAMGTASFFSHAPIALALTNRLPADYPLVMVLLSLVATVITFLLMSLISGASVVAVFGSPLVMILIGLLVPGTVMSLIHVLVAYVPCSFLNRSNLPKTT